MRFAWTLTLLVMVTVRVLMLSIGSDKGFWDAVISGVTLFLMGLPFFMAADLWRWWKWRRQMQQGRSSGATLRTWIQSLRRPRLETETE